MAQLSQIDDKRDMSDACQPSGPTITENLQDRQPESGRIGELLERLAALIGQL